jgi:hypothetical protein
LIDGPAAARWRAPVHRETRSALAHLMSGDHAMRRILFTLAATTCLILFLASAVLWVRGRYVSDCYTYTSPGNQVLVINSYAGAIHTGQIDRTSAGTIPAGRSDFTHTPVNVGAKWDDLYSSFTEKMDWRIAGFALISGQTSGTTPVSLNLLSGGKTGWICAPRPIAARSAERCHSARMLEANIEVVE